MSKKILIVIVTYNIGKQIIHCLDSLLSQTHQAFELLLIDNNSSDATLAVINSYLAQNKQLQKKTEIIQNEGNLGFAKAVNMGLKTAVDKENIYAVLLLNQDVYFTPDLLENAIKTFARYPDAGALVPQILYADKKVWWIGTRLFSDKELLFAPTYGIAEHIDKGKLVSDKTIHKTVEAVTGCSLFIRTDVIEHVGLLNEKYFMYAEDIDYSLRLKEKGYHMILFTNSTVFHQVKDTEMSPQVILTNLKKYKIYLTSIALFLLEYKPWYVFLIWLFKLPYALAYTYLRRSP